MASSTPPKATGPATPPKQPPAPERTYPVTLVLANDGAAGDAHYMLDLTEAQILRLLRDDESPHYIRLPDRYSSSIPGMPGQPAIVNETRWVRISNIAEVHVSGGWVAPDGWEWK